MKRLGSALKFLTRYGQEGDEFLDSIVTGDETWVFHHTPESKQQSRQWRHTHFCRTKIFKTSISVKKVMASVFRDRKGILLFDFMPPGATINAAAYCDTLTRLQWAIQNKRRGMSSCGVCLLHYNAWTHSAHITTVLLEKFKWDVLGHLPYSPDLTPSDFHLFLHLKKHLTGKKFDDDDEVHDSGSKGRLQTSVTPEYRSWFQDLINVWTMPAAVLKDQVMYIISFTVLLL